MTNNSFNRRDFSVRLATLISGAGLAGLALPSPIHSQTGSLATGPEVSHSSEAIHQEVTFNVPRKRVYEALTETAQFDKVVKLSMAVASGMKLGTKPTQISLEVGGAFSLFGGYISGRHLDLVPGERIVQAWRAGSWPAGDYSIASFKLSDLGADTKLIFDHMGFPNGEAAHLLEGWNGNYWEPLKKVLA
jgi:activator of HSP90 ATPase